MFVRAFASALNNSKSRSLLSGVNIRKMNTIINIYREAFPAWPRFEGTSTVKVVASPVAFGDVTTNVVFKTKEDISNENPLAAADLLEQPVNVSYSNENGVNTRTITASIGKAEDVSAASLQGAVVAAIGKLRSLKVKEVNFVLPTIVDVPASKIASVVTQAATLANYHFDRYVTVESKIPTLLTTINIVSSDSSVTAVVEKESIMSAGTILARDFCAERADEANPEAVEGVAREVAKAIGAEITVIKGNELVDRGMHLFAAVGQAAKCPPRYIELFHKGDPEHPDDVIAIVGKCITHDSGGINLKTLGGVESMHMDKGGAAAVIGAALATGKLGLKRNVVFVLAAAENSIDSNSYKPGNVIKSYKGLTVEMLNTDAEGRLVLADSMVQVQEKYRPHTLIDIATLTGACIVALGEYGAGLFTNNPNLAEFIKTTGAERSEKFWPMPIFDEHSEEIKASTEADIRSIGAGRYGGACTAAAFLQNFVGYEKHVSGRVGKATPSSETPSWAHLDIAGPGLASKARGIHTAGATGFGAQTLVHFIASAPAGKFSKNTPKKW